MIVIRTSPFNNKTYEWNIPVTKEQMDKWKAGAMIQNAMPNLSPDQREFLMTGITPDQWDETFKEVE